MSSFWKDWSDGKKWWMGILSSLALAVVGIVLARVFSSAVSPPPIGLRTGELDGRVSASTAAGSATPQLLEPKADFLPDEIVSRLVTNKLHQNNSRAAVALVKEMPDGTARSLECHHVFDFSIKKLDFEVAQDIAVICWSGEELKKMLSAIAHERAKQ